MGEKDSAGNINIAFQAIVIIPILPHIAVSLMLHFWNCRTSWVAHWDTEFNINFLLQTTAVRVADETSN